MNTMKLKLGTALGLMLSLSSQLGRAADRSFPIGPKEEILCSERTTDQGHFVNLRKSLDGRSPYLVDIDGPIYVDYHAPAYQQKLTANELAVMVDTYYGFGRLTLKALPNSRRLTGLLYLENKGISLDCIRDFIRED
jgi:hypothetical protein